MRQPGKQTLSGIIFLMFFSAGLACQGAPKQPVYKSVPLQSVQKEVLSWRVLQLAGKEEPAWLALEADEVLLRHGSQSKSIPLGPGFVDLITSRLGKYFAVFSLLPGKKTQRGGKILQVQVYSADGQLLYRIQKQQAYDDPIPARVLSDRGGALILGESATGRLIFYGPAGQRLHQVVLFPDTQYDLERLLQLAVSEDGSTVAVLASKRGPSPVDSNAPHPSGEPAVFLLDGNGNRLWQAPLRQAAPQNLALSPSGDFVFASSYSSYTGGRLEKSTTLFRRNGSVVRTLPFLFRHADFSSAANVALLADRSVTRLLELSTGELRWQVRYPHKTGMVVAARISPKADQVFVLTARNVFDNDRFIFQQPVLHVLNSGGTQLQELPFPQEKFLSPALEIRDARIFLGFRNRLYRIEAQQ